MERTHAATALALLAAVALLALAAGAAPAGAQTATPTDDADNATVETVVEVSFDHPLSAAERRQAADTLAARLNGSAGFEGSARATEEGVTVRLRPAASPPVVDLLLQRGNVTVTAHSPNATGTLFSNAGVARVGEIRRGLQASSLPVYLTPEAADTLSTTLQRLGHTANPGSCDVANRTGYCLSVRLDGSVVSTAGITAGFADAIESGNFTGTRGFALSATSLDTVTRLQVALAARPLPANATAASVENVTVDSGTPTGSTPTDASPTDTETVGTPTPGGSPTTTGTGSPGFTLPAAVLSLLVLAGYTARS